MSALRPRTSRLLALLAVLALPAAWPPATALEAGEGNPPGRVARSQFTSAVREREPVDRVQVLTNDRRRIYFFTELHGLAGQTVTHRWAWRGRVMAEVRFPVGGPRWRVWSSKRLLPSWTGTWEVSVLDGQGRVLHRERLRYVPAADPGAPSP